MPRRLPIPDWRWLRLPIDRAFDRHMLPVHAAVHGFVQAARQRLSDEPWRREQPTDLLEAMLAARDEVDGALGDATLPPSVDAARELDRIEASVNETMRLRPVAPLLLLEAAHEPGSPASPCRAASRCSA